MTDEAIERLGAIICLTVIVVTAVIGIAFTAVLTDRDVRFAEGLTFAGALLIAALGGFSLWTMRRHRWRVSVDRENGHEDQAP